MHTNKRIKGSIIFFTLLLIVCLVKVDIAKAEALNTKYNMNLEFNEEQKTLIGKETICIKNLTSTELKKLVFHLYADSYNKKETMPSSSNTNNDTQLLDEEKGDILIEKVEISNKSVNFNQENQLLTVILDNELRENKSLNISIEFLLKLPKGVSRLGYSNDVYSFTNWYPILSVFNPEKNEWDENQFNPIGESNYSDVSEYNIKIKVPNNFVLASTGKQTELYKNNSYKIINLGAKDARDFAIIMSPYFKKLSQKVDGIQINSYYIDKDNISCEKSAKIILENSVKAIGFFNKEFGKYPYKDLDIVETYCENIAMEYPELIQLGKYTENDADLSITLETAIHEVGHQWWYVTVGNNELKEPFLDESLTTFSTAYYFEKTKGEYSKEGILRALRYKYTRMCELGYSNFNLPELSSSVKDFENEYSYDLYIYRMGALSFEDLRRKVGESEFLDVIQTYFNTYKFKNSSIEAFLNIIEDKCGKDVKEYMENCIYTKNYNPEHLQLTNEELEHINN